MIRKNNLEDVTDEEFENIIIPFENEIDKYINSIIYDYAAYYLAKGYELSALWECPLKNQINSALCRFNDIPIQDGFNYKKLYKILEKKYFLKIIDDKTSQMIEINK